MPQSINELSRGKEFIPKNPRLLISEGFYDKANWLRDAEVYVRGLEIFHK